MTMWKCYNCEFFGDYDELRIEKEIDREPYGDGYVDRETYFLYCPDCGSEELTEYAEVR